MHYTFFSPKGLTLHKAGNSALTMFLNTRLYLYTNVYYHRTTRAIDLHLREIFPDTMRVIFPGNPLEHMEEYLVFDRLVTARRGLPVATKKGRDGGISQGMGNCPTP